MAAVGMQPAPGSRQFSSAPECGFEFTYPADWEVIPTEGQRCRTTLRPRNFAEKMKELDIDVYTLTIVLEDGEFLEVAAAGSFDFVKGSWVLRGRHGLTADVEVLSNERWHGLRGTAIVGCYRAAGGYAGLCEEPALVLRDDSDHVWSMRGGPQSHEAFDAVLESLRFRDQ
jgi:hypothetical protein